MVGIPSGLKELVCSGCIALDNLVGIPSGLEVLVCNKTAISSLQPLLVCTVLAQLGCSDCKNLVSLAGMPGGDRLKKLICSGCIALDSLVGVTSRLEVLV